MPLFIPPVVEDLPWVNSATRGVARRLFRYHGPAPRGRSVILKTDGTCMVVDTPVQNPSGDGGYQGIPAADIARLFQGGHVYQISDAEAALLTACLGLAVIETWGELAGLVWGDGPGEWGVLVSWDVGRSWGAAGEFYWGSF